MLELVSNYDQDIEFVVGFAGSGKSTELAKRATKDTLVLTPTHKSVDVLHAKGVEHAYTIHSVLGLVPTLNQSYNPLKNQRMQKLKKIGDANLDDINDIFIDEFSMINQEILDLLLEVLPATAKVTVFGDPYQLPPVDGEAIDPLIYTDKITELTVQHRAEAPEVVETFMRFVEYIKTGNSSISLVMNPAIKKGTIEDFNPETDRILAYTNAKVSQLNDEVARVLGLNDSFSTGDDLIANQIPCVMVGSGDCTMVYPTCISKGKLMTGSKLEETISKTEGDINKFNTFKYFNSYPTANVIIDDVVYKIHYDPNHYQTQQQLKADIDEKQAYLYKTYRIPEDMKLAEWCKLNKDSKGVRERGQAWSAYIAHSNLVFNLQRPFATTVHKSQGQEFSTVYIAQTDVKKSIRNGYYEQYARLMYVALSRAIDRVVII